MKMKIGKTNARCKKQEIHEVTASQQWVNPEQNKEAREPHDSEPGEQHEQIENGTSGEQRTDHPECTSPAFSHGMASPLL
jgi:hypothetical protein